MDFSLLHIVLILQALFCILSTIILCVNIKGNKIKFIKNNLIATVICLVIAWIMAIGIIFLLESFIGSIALAIGAFVWPAFGASIVLKLHYYKQASLKLENINVNKEKK